MRIDIPRPQPDDETFRRILRTHWGYDDFRGIQLDIIRSIAAGRDTLGLMPTGGGKSITFQVPALALGGLCLVVTPLIALMKDQVEHLRRRNLRAAAIYNGLSRSDNQRHLDNAVYGAYDFLYVSPERLGSELFLRKVARMKISFITVDEAHCISQWGYDFRPSYLKIAEIRRVLPDVPVLALTATATEEVIEDICRSLAFDSTTATVRRMSFARPNLRYIVRHTEDKMAELIHILRSVPGPAIVYTRSRQNTRDVCRGLKNEGFTALFYHAGLTNVEKDVRQKSWQEDDTRIMVATNAFGMGIDKPDVRLVVHLDLPDSIEAYFQEAGRGGRDGNTAYAVLLYNRNDHGKMLRRIPETFPDKEYIRDVYEKLAYFFQLALGDGFHVTYEFNLKKFCVNFKLFPVPVVSALNLLTRAGYIHYREEEESTSRLLFLTDRDELYNLRGISPRGDEVIRAVLRNYGGVFSDYVYIEESLLAQTCGLTENDIYETLKTLTHQRVLHYIPRKSTPYITYLQRREEGSRLHLSPEIYELRREQYEQRIHSVLTYATQETQCRSRFLLDYFSDRDSQDCGHCDICLSHRRQHPDDTALARRFLELLADGKAHRPEELDHDGFSDKARAAAIRLLTKEGRIELRDGFFRLSQTEP